MAERYTEVASADVIWPNLDINPFQQRVRLVGSWAATIGLLVLWTFPVAFVALLSNVNQLCARYTWIRWLCRLPSPINGIIQGCVVSCGQMKPNSTHCSVLPPVALALLFIVLPVALRRAFRCLRTPTTHARPVFATAEGIPLKSLVELSLMKRYFLFLFIHGFIVSVQVTRPIES
jgi:hypothetical protein